MSKQSLPSKILGQARRNGPCKMHIEPLGGDNFKLSMPDSTGREETHFVKLMFLYVGLNLLTQDMPSNVAGAAALKEARLLINDTLLQIEGPPQHEMN